jgi:hypothetical protein
LRKRREELQVTLDAATKELDEIQRVAKTQRTQLERADAIDAKKKEVQQAEARARQNPSDDNLVALRRAQRELRAITPTPEPDADDVPSSDAPAPSLCPIDALPMRPDGTCPADRRHTVGHNPYEHLKNGFKKIPLRSWWE